MNKAELEQLSDGELSNAIIDTDSGRMSHSFDINNWSDMGQLAFANKINFNYFEDDDGGYCSCTSGEFGYESHENECEHANPLRAAAIVYLLMQG